MGISSGLGFPEMGLALGWLSKSEGSLAISYLSNLFFRNKVGLGKSLIRKQ